MSRRYKGFYGNSSLRSLLLPAPSSCSRCSRRRLQSSPPNELLVPSAFGACSSGSTTSAAEVGIERSGDDIEFLFARSQLVFASATTGIGPPVGPVSVDFNDLERFRASTLRLKRLGFRSRACIHPAQVKVANEVFTPSITEVEQARLVVETFDDALNRGSGVVRDEKGAMVDEAVVRAARRLLDEST